MLPPGTSLLPSAGPVRPRTPHLSLSEVPLSRPSPVSDGAAGTARAALPDTDAPHFDRLAGAVLASAGAPLGAVLRAQLPGTAGVRWLRQEGLPPTARPTALSSEQWLSLYRCWTATDRAPGPRGTGGRRSGGRPSAHGHAPGAKAVPRWGQ